MLTRLGHIEEIMKGLSLLQYYVKFSSNKLGLHNINKACEPFFTELFNIICDTNFERSEYATKKNAVAIDSQDDQVHKSIQITSDGSKTKLWETIDKFEKYELYKEYDVLYHFIVGEKHYTPHRKDKIIFSKRDFNTYYVDKQVGKHEYQIIIIDFLDLILFIDRLDSGKIEEISKYITHNVQETIDFFRKGYQLYEDKSDASFTAETFLSYCSVEPDQEEEILSDLNKLAHLLGSLNKQRTRLFLATALRSVKYDGFGNTNLVFNPYVLKNDLSLNDLDFKREIEILTGKDLIDLDSLSYEGEYVLEYLDSARDNLLKQIYQFCITNDKPLDKLIIDVDFSVLD